MTIKGSLWLKEKYYHFRKFFFPYGCLDLLGPEHEFSIVDDQLNVLPISDKIIKDYSGTLVDFVFKPGFSFGKEFPAHILEFKANFPFSNPESFEETMYSGVSEVLHFIGNEYNAHLLGTGMHPLMQLKETGLWPNINPEILSEFKKLFNLNRHGWLNIQSFQLNFASFKEEESVKLHNLLLQLCAYLPAVAASSPIFEANISSYLDNRLVFFKKKKQEVPSTIGDVIPNYVSSFSQYKNDVIGKYSSDLAARGVSPLLLNQEWMNARGLIFRFGREALELRILDEQECVKSDVAISCFIIAALRGLLADGNPAIPYSDLVSDYYSIIKNGLDAEISHPEGKDARKICRYFFDIAYKNATESEKKYLWIIKKRIEEGSLSVLLKKRVKEKAKNMPMREAIIEVYKPLLNSLSENKPYF